MTDLLMVKQILLQVLDEIEDLTTHLAVVAAAQQPPIKLGDAYAARNILAPKATKKFAGLRKKIEGLYS